MAEQAGARTEPASARRKADARRKGQIPFSRDLSMALVLMAALGVLSLTSEATIQALIRSLREWWSMAANPRSWSSATADMLQAAMLKMGSDSLIILLPVLACVLVMATGATVAQTGFLWKQDAFSLDLSRINPIAGGPMTDLDVTGVFIAVGHATNTQMFEGQLEMKGGYIITRIAGG